MATQATPQSLRFLCRTVFIEDNLAEWSAVGNGTGWRLDPVPCPLLPAMGIAYTSGFADYFVSDILLIEHPKFRAVYEINRRHYHLHGDGDLGAYDDWRAAVMVSEGPIDLSSEMDDDEIEAAMDLAGEIR